MRWPMYLSIALVSLITGLMLSFQFRVSNGLEKGAPAGRSQELSVELHELEAEKSKLQNEINDLRVKITQATKGQQEAINAMRGELSKAKISAGLTAVSGQGIEIILDNPDSKQQTGKTASLYVIRDEDLLRLVNELRSAGAEAMSINGQRIVASSEIRYAAPFINVNLTRVTPPYHILAIGKIDYLQASLTIPGGIVEYLTDLGVRVDIQPQEKLIIPAYAGVRQYTYAKITQGR
jgi:uncharacterized protein YlxW (UPF0749 family)